MLKKAWYSITVRKVTALMIRSLAKEQRMIMDTYINSLITEKPSKKKLITCNMYGVRLKAENLEANMKQRHQRAREIPGNFPNLPK